MFLSITVPWFREVIYAAYVWFHFALLAPLTWLSVALTPYHYWAWRISGAAARLALKLARMPLVVRGLEKLPRDGPSVIVANHASFLDGILLMAALPDHYHFVAKRELLDRFVSRIYLNWK